MFGKAIGLRSGNYLTLLKKAEKKGMQLQEAQVCCDFRLAQYMEIGNVQASE